MRELFVFAFVIIVTVGVIMAVMKLIKERSKSELSQKTEQNNSTQKLDNESKKQRPMQKMVYKICKYCGCRFENRLGKCPGCGSRQYNLEYVDDPNGVYVNDIEFKTVCCETCHQFNYLGAKYCVKCGAKLPTPKEVDAKKLNSLLDKDGKIMKYPTKPNKRVALDYLCSKFDKDTRYNEKKVNEIILQWICFVDYVAIRRDMIDMGYLNRDSSGGFHCVNASKEDN